MSDTSSALLDFSQLDDIAGQAGDCPEAQAMLARIWRDSIREVNRELLELVSDSPPERVRSTLHRARGLLSMWGVSSVSKRMEVIERGESPVEDWSREKPILLGMLEVSRCEVVARHRWLEAATS
jgi:hypothetical protein